MQKLDQIFFNNLINHIGISFCTGEKIAVAVSGGVDSLVLTILLKQYAKKNSLDLVALTVNHNLRTESVDEAIYVADILKSYSIKHEIIHWSGSKPTKGIQEKARLKRYELLENWCLINNCNYLFLGHHYDDQLETLLMRLRKGSSIIGLAGMRELFNKRRCKIIRPFLNISKCVLVNTLNELKVKNVNDPSNYNLSYERVFWRTTLINYDREIKIYKYFKNIRDNLEKWLGWYFNKYVFFSVIGYVKIPKKHYDFLPYFFQSLILSYILRGIGVGNYPPSNEVLLTIIKQIGTKNFKAKTACGLRISKRNNDYYFVREYKKSTEEIFIKRGMIIALWDKRFIIRKYFDQSGLIKAIGPEGWKQMIITYPALKKIDIPRYALWSLPSFWQNNTLVTNMNMIFEEFIDNKLQNSVKTFRFAHSLPFQY